MLAFIVLELAVVASLLSSLTLNILQLKLHGVAFAVLLLYASLKTHTSLEKPETKITKHISSFPFFRLEFYFTVDTK